MMHEDRPALRNKLKSFAVAAAAGLLSLAIVFAAGGLSGGVRGIQFRPAAFSVYLGGGLIGVLVAFGVLTFWAKRWSFLVYPDRIRIRGKRRAIDIPFERITGVQVISYEHRPTLAVLWTEAKIYFDPRYPKYGIGQIRVLRGIRQIIRIDCAHQNWKKGYYLDMDEPRSFLQTLDRGLKRYRLMQSSAFTGAARQ
jgi:hypothetical protein